MGANIWDDYGDWSDMAVDESLQGLKRKITGVASWTPNHVSPALAGFFDAIVATHREYGTDACVLDFGCGLGRNLPMLRRFFPRVVGSELPEMLQRFNQADTKAVADQYDALYDELAVLAKQEQVHVVYDSVVLQHIVNVPYVATLLSKLLSMPSFKTLVVTRHYGVHQTVSEGLLLARGWRPIFSEQDTLSFEGCAHDVVVMRRPS